MPHRIRFKAPLALDCPINFLRWDCPLFHQAVRDHYRSLAMEKIQYSVMYAAYADPQFVNPVAQKVGFGAAQLVP